MTGDGAPQIPMSSALWRAILPLTLGATPIDDASGDVSRREFRALGAVFGDLYFAAVLPVGMPDLSALGVR